MKFGGFEKLTLIDYPGKIASVVYTIGCNFRCPYCHNPELVDETVEKVFPEEEIIDFLKNRRGFLDALVVTGGEPTMHEDLPAFLQKVKDLGFLVKLDSNGTNPQVLRQVVTKKLVDYLAMDIKAPLAKYHQVVSRPVDSGAIAESIRLLMSVPVEYEFRTTVVKALLSPEDLEQIGQEIKGANKYYLQRFVPTKILNPQFKRKTTYSDEEFEGFRRMLNKYVNYCGIR